MYILCWGNIPFREAYKIPNIAISMGSWGRNQASWVFSFPSEAAVRQCTHIRSVRLTLSTDRKFFSINIIKNVWFDWFDKPLVEIFPKICMTKNSMLTPPDTGILAWSNRFVRFEYLPDRLFAPPHQLWHKSHCKICNRIAWWPSPMFPHNWWKSPNINVGI